MLGLGLSITQVAARGRAAAPSSPLLLATAGSSTLERYFSDYTGYTDNPRVTVSTDGSTFSQLGGTGAGAHALGDLLVTGLNRDVLFLKSAVRGTTLAQWEAAGSTYRAALVAGIAAMGGVDALLFQCGYNDATSSSTITVASHAAMLRSFVAKVRAETGLPNLKVLLGGSQRNLAGNNTNEGRQAGIIRRAEMVVADDANVYFACPTYDIPLAADNIHQTEAGYTGISAPRWAQSIISVVRGGAAKRGPRVVSAAPVSSTQTDVTLEHRAGTDFTPATGITGWTISKDAGATWAEATGARTSATTVRLTHPDAGGAEQQLLYAAEGAPNVTAVLLDNTAPEPMPMEVTPTAIPIAAIVAPLSISGTPGAATQGAAYSYTPTVSGGTAPYSFARTGTALPAGLSFSTSTGAITGTPTDAGTVSGIIITVTDALGGTVSQTVSIVVNASSAEEFVDAFAATDGTSLSGRTPDVGAAWTVPTGAWDIRSNRARCATAPGNALGGTTLSSADQWVEADFVVVTVLANSHAVFLLARAQDTSNFYQAGYRGSTGALSIGKTIGGTFTELASLSYTPVEGQVAKFRLEASGSILRLLIDGAVVLTAPADTSISSAGKPGIRTSGVAAGTATGIHVDNFRAGPL